MLYKLYIIVCLPAYGDSPLALASELSPIQVDLAKDGMGGTIVLTVN